MTVIVAIGKTGGRQRRETCERGHPIVEHIVGGKTRRMCNTAIGLLRDDRSLLESAARYVGGER